MKRIDLDDLPPKLAALLAGLARARRSLLVQGGAVVGRADRPARQEPSAARARGRPPDEEARQGDLRAVPLDDRGRVLGPGFAASQLLHRRLLRRDLAAAASRKFVERCRDAGSAIRASTQG